MIYRNIGNTGKKASIIGLGCEHLDGKSYRDIEKTIHCALENGVNILDIFMPGHEVRENIARALGSRRKDVLIQGHIGSTDINQQYDISRDMPSVKKYFEDMLRLYGGYIDFGMMFFIDSEKDFKDVFEGGIARYAEQLKKDGYIGHIGFSSHNPEIAAKVVETGLPEIMLFSINPAFDMYPVESNVLDTLESSFDHSAMNGIDPKRTALYKLCEQKGVGITVMKTFGAGKLLSPEHTPFEKPLTTNQCIHYALTRPAVTSILPGCQTPGELLDLLKYLEASDEEKDYAGIVGQMQRSFSGHCVYCSHCQPCPVDIDIAAVNKYLDIALLDTDHVPPSIRSHYQQLESGGSQCIACGSCESRCPFAVPVIENMQKAASIFEK